MSSTLWGLASFLALQEAARALWHARRGGGRLRVEPFLPHFTSCGWELTRHLPGDFLHFHCCCISPSATPGAAGLGNLETAMVGAKISYHRAEEAGQQEGKLGSTYWVSPYSQNQKGAWREISLAQKEKEGDTFLSSHLSQQNSKDEYNTLDNLDGMGSLPDPFSKLAYTSLSHTHTQPPSKPSLWAMMPKGLEASGFKANTYFSAHIWKMKCLWAILPF